MAELTDWPTWQKAWDDALYGAGGFYRRESPAAHFRTSVHASPLFAIAVLTLARAAGLHQVVDVGAGRGELLLGLHGLDPEVELLGVEVAARPAGLPAEIGWSAEVPDGLDALVVANEWLDNVPCHVVEVDADDRARILHVDPSTGDERPGVPLDDEEGGGLRAWTDRWWPLGPGGRAEVGSSRDRAWADVVARLRRGVALAIDYGHLRENRPRLGSLRSYRDGREVDVRPDRTRDVTAHVAVDAVGEAVGGSLLRQADALRRLGLDGSRPPLDLAHSDPGGYVAGLSRATEAVELTDPAGLGGFFWVLTTVGDCRLPWR